MTAKERVVELIRDPEAIDRLTDPDSDTVTQLGDMLLRAYYPEGTEVKLDAYEGLWYEYGKLPEGSAVLLAKEDEAFIGSLVMTPVEMADYSGVWEVHGIAVDPESRQGGIATGLYREFFADTMESDRPIKAIVGVTNNVLALNVRARVCAEFGGKTVYGREAQDAPVMQQYLSDLIKAEPTFAFTDTPGVLAIDPRWLPHNVSIPEIGEAYEQNPDKRFAVPVITTFAER